MERRSTLNLSIVTAIIHNLIMSGQMRLIEIEERIPNWALDRQTREVGLKGVAVARAILEKKSGKSSPSLTGEMQKFRIAGN